MAGGRWPMVVAESITHSIASSGPDCIVARARKRRSPWRSIVFAAPTDRIAAYLAHSADLARRRRADSSP